MQKIYIILTNTGTLLGRIIKLYTRDEFSHVSISLDKKLYRMYSFGRLRPYNPFIGGFVHEKIDEGTFKRFYKTKCEILELEINDVQYENLVNNIEEIKKNRSKYKFNVAGLFSVVLNKKVKKDYYFYCAEFVKYVLEKSDIKYQLPEIIRPQHFKEIKESEKIYSGLLREYNDNKVYV